MRVSKKSDAGSVWAKHMNETHVMKESFLTGIVAIRVEPIGSFYSQIPRCPKQQHYGGKQTFFAVEIGRYF